jgi:protein-tyrosine phosphatase
MRRSLDVAGLVNARDLGGLRRRDGSVTPTGVFYRSENVDWITRAGWDQVHAAGIRTVVDLRQQVERDRDTNPRPDWLTTVHADLDGLDDTEFWAGYWDNGLVGTALYYLPHLARMPDRSVAALTAILRAPEGGVLFHCMSGRDRTGMISLLLLTAVDTEPDAILDDYLETVRLGDARGTAMGRTNPEPLVEKICGRHGTTTAGAFRAALAGLDLASVLAQGGIGDADLTALRTWRGALKSGGVIGEDG